MAEQTRQAPDIALEDLVRVPGVQAFDLSPDGRQAVFTWNASGNFQIYVVPLDGGVIETLIPASEVAYYAARLLPLGADLVVEAPPQLIAARRRLAREILARYPATGAEG